MGNHIIFVFEKTTLSLQVPGSNHGLCLILFHPVKFMVYFWHHRNAVFVEPRVRAGVLLLAQAFPDVEHT